MSLRITTPRGWGSLKRLLLWLPLLLAGPAAIAAITLNGVSVVNVTPSSFSVLGTCSSAIDSNATVAVSVFADAAGVTSLAGRLGLELYPLHTGSPAATNSYDRRLNEENLRRQTKNLGLAYARVSGCTPNTPYYYRLQISKTNGEIAVWPTNGPLPSVTTAPENLFVRQSQELIISLGELSPSGAVVLLSNTNTPTVLAAVVGDGVGTNQVFFSINEMMAAAGNTNVLPSGTQEFTAAVIGLAPGSIEQSYSLGFSTNFVVGSSSDYFLGSFVALSLGSNAVLAGQGGNIPISLRALTFLTNFSFTLSLPTNRFSSLSLQALVPQVGSASLRAIGPDTLQVAFGASAGQSLLGNQQIAQLKFVTVSNQTSAFVPLAPQALQGTNNDASAVSQATVQPGRLVIVGQQSLLEALQTSGGGRSLALYGRPGASYQVESVSDLSNSRDWAELMRVPMTNILEVLPLASGLPEAFYRAYEFTASPPIIDIGRPVNGTISMVLYGTPWQAYEVGYADSLSYPFTWNLLRRLPLTNSFQIFTASSSGPGVFYRAQPLNADPPLLEANRGNQNRSLLVYGVPGTNYTLQYATNISAGAVWSPLLGYTLTNSFQFLTNLGNAEPLIFYRIKRP